MFSIPNFPQRALLKTVWGVFRTLSNIYNGGFLRKGSALKYWENSTNQLLEPPYIVFCIYIPYISHYVKLLITLCLLNKLVTFSLRWHQNNLVAKNKKSLYFGCDRLKKPIKIKTFVQEFLHRIRHAPTHGEFEFYIKNFAFWFETVVLEFRWNFLSL